MFDKPAALNPAGSSSPDYVPLIPAPAHASHLFPFRLPRPAHGGQSPAGVRFLARMSNAGSLSLDLGFVQLGNLLEAEGSILPPPRTASVLAGALQAGGTFGEHDFISTWVSVESTARSQVLEDFAMLLPLSRRHFRARQAVAWPSAPRAVPAGSKGRADGCIAKGNRCREASREKLRPPASAAVPGSCLTHGDVAGGALGRLAAGPQEQEVLDWSHGLCGSVVGACMACGHVSMTLAQLWWDGEVS